MDAALSGSELAQCRNLLVTPLRVPAGGKVDSAVGESFSAGIASRLRADYGDLFELVREVSEAEAKPVAGECVLVGEITKYKPGSRIARFILIGLGAASLEGSLTVRDDKGEQLLYAPFDKLWAWGGLLGASKDINRMAEEADAAAAMTLAAAKGWKPADKQQ